MDNEKLLKALGRLSVETGSLACLGCGWEHDCNTHGCAANPWVWVIDFERISKEEDTHEK